jgi:hypothetical protein
MIILPKILRLWLFLLSLGRSLTAQPRTTTAAPDEDCEIAISEINTDDVGSREFMEFIELHALCRGASLRNYMLIIVKEHDERLGGPVVVFSADFYRQAFKPNKVYFVVGSPNDEMKAKIDMTFTDNNVGFYRKGQIGGQTTIGRFFPRSSAPVQVMDVLPNGNDYPHAAILLRQDVNEQDRGGQGSGITKLSLTTYNPVSRRTTTASHLKLDDQLINIIKNHAKDMVVYSRRSIFNDCGFFRNILPRPVPPPQDIEINLPKREWDRIGHEDLSINRCPRSPADRVKPFLFAHWKIGKRTPGSGNDCTGTAWLVEENLPQIFEAQGEDMPTDPSGINVPQVCSGSTSVGALAKVEAEKVVTNRDETIGAASDAPVCAAISEEEREADLRLDAAVDKVRDLLRSLVQQQRLEPDPRQPDEPPAKIRCIDTQTEEPAVRPWLDDSHFTKAVERQIEQHQHRYVKTAWLTPARKAWLKYIFKSEDPGNSKFQCRFCADYVQRHHIAENVPDLAKPEGFFVKNLFQMKNKILRHTSLGTHRLAEQELKKKYTDDMGRCLTEWKKASAERAGSENLKTGRMTLTVYVETQLNIPFDGHSAIVDMQKKNGADLGIHHYERTSATKMMDCTADCMRTTLRDYIQGELLSCVGSNNTRALKSKFS